MIFQSEGTAQGRCDAAEPRSLEGRRERYWEILGCFFGKLAIPNFSVSPIQKWLRSKLLQIKIVTYFLK